MIANTFEMLAHLKAQDREREWKMAALAAQLPRGSHAGLRDLLARALRAIARLPDPDLAVAAEHMVLPA